RGSFFRALHVQRLLPAAPVHERQRFELAGLGGAVAVPQPPSGAMEPDDGGDARRHGAGRDPLLPGPAGIRGGCDAHGGQGMKLAVVGAGSTYTPELVAGLAGLEIDRLALHDVDPLRLDVVGGLAGRMLDRADFRGELALLDRLDESVEG